MLVGIDSMMESMAKAGVEKAAAGTAATAALEATVDVRRMWRRGGKACEIKKFSNGSK